MISVNVAVVFVIIALLGGCAIGILGILGGIRAHQTDGILYIDSSTPGEPVIYTTLNEDVKKFRNGQFKLFLVRRIKK